MPTNRRGKGKAVAQGATDRDAQTAHNGTRGSRGSVAPPTSPREERRYRRAGALADSGAATAATTTTSAPTAATVPSLCRIEGAGVSDAAVPPHSVDSLAAVLLGPSSQGKIAEHTGAGIVDSGTVIIPAADLPGKNCWGNGPLL